MKGITPVIAIILLLMLTVSMVGFAFVWFQRVAASVTNRTASEIASRQNQMAQTIRIDNAGTTTVTVRNTGSVPISNTTLAVYVDNVLQACTWDVASIPPLGFAECTPISCPVGSTIRVTAPGNSDEDVCG